jgi:hypothetical protein
MRKVVDTNLLQSDVLRSYLSKSIENYAVLTDYAAMEAYKGDTLSSIYRSMEILATRPRQVIVLKGTQTICGIRGRTARLQRRMIDEHQTREFGEYCRLLRAARNGNWQVEKQLLEHGREATAHLDRMVIDAKRMPKVFEAVAKTFTEAELRLLRTTPGCVDQMFDKVISHVVDLAASMFRDHPKVSKFPSWAELDNTFIFRFSLCAYLWVLKWISVGGGPGTSPERLRNDMVDVNFAAFATYFDGLLTADRKAAVIHQDAVSMLRTFRAQKMKSRY